MPDSPDGGRRVASQLDAQHKQADPPGLQPLLLGPATATCRRSCSAVTFAMVSAAVSEASSSSGTTTPMKTPGETRPPMILAVNDETARRRSAGPSASAACQGRFSALGHARNDDAATSGGKGAMTPRTAVAAPGSHRWPRADGGGTDDWPGERCRVRAPGDPPPGA